MNNKNEKDLSYYTGYIEIENIISELREEFDNNKPLKVSDVTDAHGNQYVNLVQEGGGVLGIALVGFTYVLEEMGIRFWRLAGTSAGAINTMLLGAIGKKHEPKSKKILKYLAEVNLLDFVDGHEVVSSTLAKLIANPNYLKNVANIFLTLFGSTVLCLILNVFHSNLVFEKATIVLLFSSLIAVIILLVLWLKFKNSNWGLCKGKVFREWMIDILNKNGVHNFNDLKDKSEEDQVSANLKVDSPTQAPLKSDLTIIASNITSKKKVEFPADNEDYNLGNYHPATIVRASMSIPFFYEAHNIPDSNGEVNLFVDGGVISNFPINIFHNPEIKIARLPVFAIDLVSDPESDKGITNSLLSLGMRIFNTIRYHSDKDFLLKNKFYEDYCIAPVNVSGFNWLNFAMDDKTKLELFVQGAKGAQKFLNEFKWENYKEERKTLI